jgi:hypothetical protein
VEQERRTMSSAGESLRQAWRELRRLRATGGRGRNAAHKAAFDPVRVESDLYEALYGRRSGAVDNVAPRRTSARRARDLQPARRSD